MNDRVLVDPQGKLAIQSADSEATQTTKNKQQFEETEIFNFVIQANHCLAKLAEINWLFHQIISVIVLVGPCHTLSGICPRSQFCCYKHVTN